LEAHYHREPMDNTLKTTFAALSETSPDTRSKASTRNSEDWFPGSQRASYPACSRSKPKDGSTTSRFSQKATMSAEHK
jgi:hypothetical protein